MLDFSALSDEQLLQMLVGIMREASSRQPEVTQAARDAMFSEIERHRVMQSAGADELRALRAREREQAAAAARDQARALYDERRAGEIERVAREQAAAAKRSAAAREAASRALLVSAGSLADHSAAEISIVYADTPYGRRVLINRGMDRYSRDHLADYNCDRDRISTKRALIPAKNDLAALCREVSRIAQPPLHIRGDQFDWSTR